MSVGSLSALDPHTRPSARSRSHACGKELRVSGGQLNPKCNRLGAALVPPRLLSRNPRVNLESFQLLLSGVNFFFPDACFLLICETGVDRQPPSSFFSEVSVPLREKEDEGRRNAALENRDIRIPGSPQAHVNISMKAAFDEH